MRLFGLLKGFLYQIVQGDENVRVTGLTQDSRKVRQGAVFVCIRGKTCDGHRFIDDAAAGYAAAIIIDKSLERKKFPKQLTVIRVIDTSSALAKMAAAWYGYPERSMTLIGITGTKGKTTTAYMLRSIFESAGYRTGLIGTNEVWDGRKSYPAGNTTPDTILLHGYLDRMRRERCRFVVMEVSSQALMQKRVDGIIFDTAVFTNLGIDHIGEREHKDFGEYKACKAKLFGQCRYAVLNADDPSWREMLGDSDCGFATYGRGENEDYRAGRLQKIKGVIPGEAGKTARGTGGYLGMSYLLSGRKKGEIILRLPGSANVYNSLAALAAADHYGIEMKNIRRGICRTQVRGRGEIFDAGDGSLVIVDYAHNALSLQKILRILREYGPKRLVCVFGCGGGRSDMRRSEMGRVSGKYADFTIITSDNPRYEDPKEIMRSVEKGVCRTGGKYIMIEDREEAIRYAVGKRNAGDFILIAGKGHEDYQEIRGVRYPMDDGKMVEGALHVR